MAHTAAEIKGVACFDGVRFARGLICPADPCDVCVGGELEDGASHGAFDDGGFVGVADEAVGDGGEDGIGGTSG